MRKLLLTAAATALLLAGCAAAPSDALPAPTPESTAQTEPAPTTTPADTAAQTAVLDGFVAYGSDTAGGSLKNAQAAAALVEYLSRSTIDTAAAADWRAGLDEEKQNMLFLNWDGIVGCARAICADPAQQAELLQTAGVETDFTAFDLTGVPEKLDALDSVLSADTIGVIQ